MKIYVNDIASSEIRDDFILGTAVNIDVIYDDAPDSVEIEIINSTLGVEIAQQAMTTINSRVYNYVFQSVDCTLEGEYIVTITTTIGSGESVIQEFFNMKRRSPYGTSNAV